jgi:LysM repeat protein
MRKFIFKDETKGKELVLPVTPPSYEVSHGINIETINIHTLGDVILPSYGTLPIIKISCMFPAKNYPFNQPGTELNPYKYIEKFIKWCDRRTILKFVVSDTKVDVKVVISDISYGEKDGTGDVYATINLREYKKISVTQTDKTGNGLRGTEKDTVGKGNYIIKNGDTLWAICRKHYGDVSLVSKLAAYNDIKNVNLIYTGNKLKLPDRSLL